MAIPQIQADPIYQLPHLYIQGLQIGNITTTTLEIQAGQCRDSTDNIDIPLGSPDLEGLITPAPLLVDLTKNGVNGLDTGTLAVNTLYAVYMIADSSYFHRVAAIVTLWSNAAPLLPFGYDSFRLIGTVSTDAAAHLIPPADIVLAGVVVFTDKELDIAGVPAVLGTIVKLNVLFTSAVNGDSIKFRPSAGGSQVTGLPTVIGPTAGVQVIELVDVPISITAGGKAAIAYVETNALDLCTIQVLGYYTLQI